MPFTPLERRTIFVSCSRDMAAAVPVVQGVVDAREEDGWAPIHYAAAFGSVATVRQLMTKESIQARTEGGLTPLHLAAENGNTSIVDLLLICADTEARDRLGRAPLHLAARHGYVEVVEALLARALGGDPTREIARLEAMRTMDAAAAAALADGGGAPISSGEG